MGSLIAHTLKLQGFPSFRLTCFQQRTYLVQSSTHSTIVSIAGVFRVVRFNFYSSLYLDPPRRLWMNH
jgi:hypothetical protein